MCGRSAIPFALRQLADRFDADLPDLPFQPTYNAAPGQHLPVIVEIAPGQRQIQLMHWGLVARWTSKKPLPPPINARAETVSEKPMFRDLIAHKRCLMPAAGFYEWQERGSGKSRQPYFIRVKDEPSIAFACIWDDTKPEGAPDYVAGSFAVVTTAANDAIASIHHRMPVILDKSEEALWLASDVQAADAVLPLLDAFPAERIEVVPISKRVNSVRNDGEMLIEPVGLASFLEQRNLF